MTKLRKRWQKVERLIVVNGQGDVNLFTSIVLKVHVVIVLQHRNLSLSFQSLHHLREPSATKHEHRNYHQQREERTDFGLEF